MRRSALGFERDLLIFLFSASKYSSPPEELQEINKKLKNKK